ncbi:MAG: NADH-quinone oxidoreductase subunit J [Caldilineales bacterium]|nr:NADH-quinone oxidoreductase subunit J [Caldilineales bacterium]
MAQQALFLIMAVFTLGMALGTVTSRNIFHSALFLVGSFAGVAVIYFLLEAEFVGVAQIIIYIGAIATLIIFAIMLSRSVTGQNGSPMNRQWAFAALGAALLFAALAWLFSRVDFGSTAQPVPEDAIALIGAGLVTEYVIPFEVASILLLVALVGAILIARERHS